MPNSETRVVLKFLSGSDGFIIQKVYFLRLKGLSQELDLAFDDMNGWF
jgi:hypothetical protein